MTVVTKQLSNRFSNMSFACALLVVLIHVPPLFSDRVGALTGPIFHGGAAYWVLMHVFKLGFCQIAVPFFFFASGFFLAGHCAEENWYRKEVSKRVLTLVVPFFVWAFLYTLFNYCLFGRPIHWISDLGLSFEKPALTSLWFVRSLFFLVVGSPILVAMLKRSHVWRIVLLLLFLVYLLISPWPCFSCRLQYHLFYFTSLAGLFWFFAGMAFRSYGGFALGRRMLMVTDIGAICLLIARIACDSIGSPLAPFLGCLSVPFLMFVVWRRIPTCEIFPRISKCAFGVFVIHRFVLVCVSSSSINSCLDTIFLWMLTVLISILVTMTLHMSPKVSSIALGGR